MALRTARERAQLWRAGIWITAEGDRLHVSQMETSHLINVARLMLKRAREDCPSMDPAVVIRTHPFYAPLAAELQARLQLEPEPGPEPPPVWRIIGPKQLASNGAEEERSA